MHRKSPSITSDPNTVQNKSKLIDLVKRIELTRAILMPRFSNFLRNSTLHFGMFLYLVTCYLRGTVSLLWRLQAVPKIHVPIYPSLIREGKRNCSTLWPAQQRSRDSQETCYQILIHAKMDSRISASFENRGFKITRVNSIHIAKSINITLILYSVVGPLWCWQFKLTARE